MKCLQEVIIGFSHYEIDRDLTAIQFLYKIWKDGGLDPTKIFPVPSSEDIFSFKIGDVKVGFGTLNDYKTRFGNIGHPYSGVNGHYSQDKLIYSLRTELCDEPPFIKFYKMLSIIYEPITIISKNKYNGITDFRRYKNGKEELLDRVIGKIKYSFRTISDAEKFEIFLNTDIPFDETDELSVIRPLATRYDYRIMKVSNDLLKRVSQIGSIVLAEDIERKYKDINQTSEFFNAIENREEWALELF